MILITGGLGFIGLHTARAFLENGEDVILTQYQTVRIPTFLSSYIGKRAFIEPLDVRDGPSVLEVGRKYAITGIVHLAGAKIAGISPADGLRDNTLEALNVLEAGKQLGVSRVSLASSATVYLGLQAERWQEDAPLPVASPHLVVAYKKELEILGSFYAINAQMSVVSLRIPLVYGPLYRGMNNLASRMVHAAVQGLPGPLPLPGPQLLAGQTQSMDYEGDDVWDLCYAPDCGAAIACVQLSKSLHYPVYNIGGGESITNGDIAEAVRKAVPGAQIELKAGRGPAPRVPPLDLSRIRADTGWTPRFDLETGIADYVAWLKSGNPQ